MVGYGSALRMARRSGWEQAYVDYEALKLVLTRIEAVYEEAFELERSVNDGDIVSKTAEELLFASFEDHSGDESLDEVENDNLKSYSVNNLSLTQGSLVIKFGHASKLSRPDVYPSEELPLRPIYSEGMNEVGLPSSYGGIYGVSNSLLMDRSDEDTHQVHVQKEARSADNESAQPKISFHMRRAHRKARHLAERFFGLLQSEVEKVSLFALSRQGELADTIGSLRFGDQTTNNEYEISSSVTANGGLWNNPYHTHPSDSSSSNDDRNGSFDDSIDEGIVRVERRNRISISGTRGTHKKRLNNRYGQYQEHLEHARPLFHRSDLVVGEDLMLSTGVDEMDAYTSVGIELLHVLRYICINAMAVRKILKKHDKLLSNCMLGGRVKIARATETNTKLLGSADVHLQNLANSLAIDAILESLIQALNEYQLETSRAEMLQKTKVDANTGFKSFRPVNHDTKAALRSDSFDYMFVKALSASERDDMSNETYSVQSSFSKYSMSRLDHTVSQISELRRAAVVMNTPFDAFLHRSALMVTGQNLGGLAGSNRDALELLLSFDPDSIFDMNVFSGMEKADVYQRGSVDNFETSFHANLDKEDVKPQLNWTSQYLNILSVFLFTTNYYIVTPTAPNYAVQLGHHPSMAGSLIGVTSVAALLAALICSYLPLVSSFRFTLILSSFWSIIGNLLYAYAITNRSFCTAMVGRALVGLGSAETVSRVIIASTVPKQYVSLLSGVFVAAGALGMSVGPFLAGVLDNSVGRDNNIDVHWFGGLIVNNLTSPGFLCAFLWLIQHVLLISFFEEPENIHGRNYDHREEMLKLSRSYSDIRVDLKETYSSPDKASDGPHRKLTINTDSSIVQQSTSRGLFTFEALRKAWKLVTQTRALPVTLLLYFFIELADEVIISSCAIITSIYFQWQPANAGFMVASLGILSLPANIFIESAIKLVDERTIMVKSLVFIGCSLFCLINIQAVVFDYVSFKRLLTVNYTFTHRNMEQSQHELYDWCGGVYQYVIAISLTFIGTIILEGVVTSLMSKASSPKLNKSFLNCGLLATLIGTLGRITGDALITFAGRMRNQAEWDFVNALFIPLVSICIFGLIVVRKNYFYLSC